MNNTNAFAIEVHGTPAGLVVGGHGGYTFFASDWAFKELDRRVFRHVRHAERAAAQILAGKPLTRSR